jgi:hypothetical protein
MRRRVEKSIILEDYRPQIEEYCKHNGLSVGKIYNSGGGGNDKEGWLYITGYWYPDRGYLGMLDELPSPLLLAIYLENGKLRFVQTEHTHALADDGALVPPPIQQEGYALPQMSYGEANKLAFA